MAYIFPAVPDLTLKLTLHPVDDVIAGEIPTDEQIVTANFRLRKFQFAHEAGYTPLSNADYSTAIIRQHKMVSVRADNELGNGNVNIANQLTSIQEAIQALHDEMNAQFDGINKRLDEIEAKIVRK